MRSPPDTPHSRRRVSATRDGDAPSKDRSHAIERERVTDLRLQTLPGFKLPPPYQVGFGDSDGFIITTPKAKLKLVKKLKPSNVEVMREGAIETYKGLCAQLTQMLTEGIRSNGDEWIDYWEAEGRLAEFRDLFDSIRVLQRRIVDLGGEVCSDEENDSVCHAQIAESIEDVEGQLLFAEKNLARAARTAHQLVREPLPEALQQQDAELAARFNYAISWALLALNSLLVATSEPSEGKEPREPLVITEHFLGAAIAAARHFSLEANHFAREGRRLRAGVTPVLESPEAEVGSTDEVISDADLADVEATIEFEESLHG